MNTQTQEALHKALKVLNCLNNDRVYETAWVKGAINACEEALATNEESLLVQPNALKMAIEALENIHNWLPTIGQRGLRDYEYDALEACKKALAQPQPKLFLDLSNSNGNHPVQQEPVAVVETIGGYPDESVHTVKWLVKYKDLKDGDKLYTHPAPSCDKVSRLEVIDNNGRSYVNWGVDKMEFSYQDDGKTLKIFTNGSGAKPSWQGLSDDEIFSLCTYIDHDLLEEAFYRGARAAEQALKEKNT